MRVTFTARHFRPSERLKEYAQGEVQRFKKYYDNIIDCEIILDYQKTTQIAEIVLSVSGSRLAVVEKSEDMYKSVDLAVAKLERKLRRYKEKHYSFKKEKVASAISTEQDDTVVVE